ncbi:MULTISPECIES: DUF5655 domain-containing protein [Staphylococcus]|uniref:DUF5655 domain-containing protein n=1 Tax=Staphylococcus TaxID=1279 RepID=UPI0008A34D56|nr:MULTISPECIES: DUF5655 domain-containing protein [Staphylococcus]OFU78953.1 transporter [Staphylococcus sp. HMSC10C03]PNZ42890.1 DUF91 domain-containing protein [Staphylococcus simulans]SQE72983.1 Uncharacterized conserved protein [Staphylococcus simulans]
MADIKLFDVNGDDVRELTGQSVTIEKELQTMIENHLETFLGVKFLASEYTTGRRHGGRIDTLGIDENNVPVIIEYKRTTNENVINQGLFYLDWLLDHKGEFQMKVMQQLGRTASEEIDWSNPRLVCIAGNFTKYDEHAVQLIDRNIELYRYSYYDNRYLLLELVNVNTPQVKPVVQSTSHHKASHKSLFLINVELASDELTQLYDDLYNYVMSLGDDVQFKAQKFYGAFKRIKNFVCVEMLPKKGIILMYVRIDTTDIEWEPGFSKDMTHIGHYGTGNVALTLRNKKDLEKAKSFIEASYENN